MIRFLRIFESEEASWDEILDYDGYEMSMDEVCALLDSQRVSYKRVKWDNGDECLAINQPTEDRYRSDITVWDGSSLTPGDDFIWGLSDMELWSLVGKRTEKPDFWSKDNWNFPGICYHSTEPENLESIQKYGLTQQNKTRGLTNRGTGAAVFCCTDPHHTEFYGKLRFQIDLSAMRADGYMPKVETEEPVQEAEMQSAVAHALGIDNFYPESLDGDGISEETLVIFGDIPPKYLSVDED